jgi:NitT/TauT family transport system substrate-binding protein
MVGLGGSAGGRFRGAFGLAAVLALSLLLVAAGCTPGPSTRAPAAEGTAPETRPAQADRPASGPAASATAPTQPAATSSAPAALQPAAKVKTGVNGFALEAGHYIAQERGYFREEGLEVEFVPFARGIEQIAPLTTGEIHFGNLGPDPGLFNAALRGIDVRIVAHNGWATAEDGHSGLIVRSDLLDSGQFKELKDLKGLNVALGSLGTTPQLYLERIAARAGITPADYQLTVVPYPEIIGALANKALDAAYHIEPSIAIADAQGVARSAIRMGEIYPGILTNVVLLSPVFAQDQPEAARRYITAHLRGQRDYYRAVLKNEGGRDEIVQILSKNTALKDPELYARMGWHGVEPNGEPAEWSLDEMQEAFIRFGGMQQKADTSKLIDRSYLDYALGRLGRLP